MHSKICFISIFKKKIAQKSLSQEFINLTKIINLIKIIWSIKILSLIKFINFDNLVSLIKTYIKICIKICIKIHINFVNFISLIKICSSVKLINLIRFADLTDFRIILLCWMLANHWETIKYANIQLSVWQMKKKSFESFTMLLAELH